ncbi:integrase [Gossypium australe]|uniref:Integrase n=1 Tax=Gossypium australe TaxID=47621 RepID=A0A5B6WQM1_9ROSI|nr:integrase [Gossypium australe]
MMILKWKMRYIYDRLRIEITLISEKKDTIWVVIDRLTKFAYLFQLYKMPISIIPNRDPRSISRLWRKLQEALSTRLYFSTEIQLQIDGKFERMIQIIEDMLCYYVLSAKLSGKMVIVGRIHIHEVELIRDFGEKMNICDKVFLKLSPSKRTLRCGRQEKLTL